MGIKTSSARLLAYLKREGESNLRSVCMLGRQELCLTERQIKAFCKDYKDVFQGDFLRKFFEGTGSRADSFIRCFGF